MKKYRVLLITHQLLLSVIYAAAVDHDSEPGMETIAKLDNAKLPKTDSQVNNPGGPPGGPALMEFEMEGMPKQPILDVPVPMEASDPGATLANELLAQAVVEQEEKAEEFDYDLSLENPRKTMRLSAEIEVADLRPFAPKSDGGYIRFFFLDDLATEIGKLPFSKLRKSARIGISDDILIPSKKFAIAYDFRSAKDEPLSGMHWTCNSVHNKEGILNPFGIYEEDEVGNKNKKRKIRNKINAVRLKAFIGGQSKEDPFIRMGLVAPRYSDGKPILKPVEKQELAPEKTMFDDVALITEAIQKYGKRNKAEVAVVDPGESILGSNNYAPLRHAQEIGLPDYSVTIAGEYIMLAQKKYNKIVTKADAPKLIALFRNYGVVTRATADELAEYLGLQ